MPKVIRRFSRPAKTEPTQKKRISFDPRGNRVRFVQTVPRSRNTDFWFTEVERVVRKGLQFEVEPNIDVDVSTDVRLQITAVAQALGKVSASPPAGAPHGRSFLEVQELLPSFSGVAAVRTRKWHTLGSVGVGEISRLRIILPAGSYLIRCVGHLPVQVFGQAWDRERELV